MAETAKTVFISYRRDVNKYPARLVFKDLRVQVSLSTGLTISAGFFRERLTFW